MQGARQVRERRADARFVFLLPPSLDGARARLRGRGTDAPEVVERRLALARRELAAVHAFDYAVVNDDVERAIETLREIVAAERAGDAAAVRARHGRRGRALARSRASCRSAPEAGRAQARIGSAKLSVSTAEFRLLRFNDIADRVLEYDPECDLALLQRAYVFSAKVHEGQERLSGEPYLIHPLEVAGILLEMRLDSVTVAAGLLHDTVEDTLTTLDELQRLFGDEVAFLVEGLTKISKIEFNSARERQAENFRKMLVAMSKDIRILLIKLADRLHNMRTLAFLPEDGAPHRAGDARHLRAARAPARHRLDAARARGPRVPHARARPRWPSSSAQLKGGHASASATSRR